MKKEIYPMLLGVEVNMAKTALNRLLRSVKDYTYLNRLARRTKGSFPTPHDGFLNKITSVIHVGANTGQERNAYARNGLNVLWIEPIPEVFDRLIVNLADFPKQHAVKALVTDKEGTEYNFNLCNNDGLSSSILKLKEKEIWPEIDMVGQIKLKSRTLDNIVAENGGTYDALIMDTQGSELLVLKGAPNLLKKLRYIKTEASNFEFYEGCTNVAELTDYLCGYGFKLIEKSKFAETDSGEHYYCDLTFISQHRRRR